MLTDRSLRKLAKAMDMGEEYLRESIPPKGASMSEELIDFLADNPDPPDSDVHDWAEEKGYDTDEVEAAIYKFATLYIKFLTGGKWNGSDLQEDEVDPDELEMGIEVEYEHTPDEATARRIALDHLAEIDNYYTLLKKMEDSAKNE